MEQLRALSLCESLRDLAGHVVVSTSCSLLHVPFDLRAETSEQDCARQKVDEVVALGRALTQSGAVPEQPGTVTEPALRNLVAAAGQVRA